MKKLENYIKSDVISDQSPHPGIVYLACFILSILNGLLYSYLASRFFPNLAINPVDNEDRVYQFILACLLAPVFETFLFQFLPNRILTFLTVKNTWLLIIIPSIVFAFDHTFNPLYMVTTFIGGILMNFLYIYCGSNKQAFLYVVLLHFSYNLFAFYCK